MILAGGTGEELSVLTRIRAKTAIPFGGRYRIIDFCLSNCSHSGIRDIAVLAQYSPKSLVEHIRMGKPWDLDRKSGGVYILQPTHDGRIAQWYLGTADALYQNIDVIRNSSADHVLVLSGDQVYVMDYRALFDFHRSCGTPMTITVKEVSPSQRSRFGMVRCSSDGLVTAFKEKPVSSTFRYASLGIYLFEKNFLLDVLNPGTMDIVFDVVIPLLDKREVAGYRFDGYWEDIGSIPSYFRASRRLLKRRSIITDPHWPIFTRSADLPPAKFSAGCEVVNSIVSDGCRIGGAVSGSVLFPGASVERGAVVRDSVLFPFSRVLTGALVRKSILDKEARIGKGARIGVDRAGGRGATMLDAAEGSIRTLGDIPVIGKGTSIAGGTNVPRGIAIEPYSKVKARGRT
jgi:glucose-1-phosphate adenylyltransferase